jgi:hypothetical protein
LIVTGFPLKKPLGDAVVVTVAVVAVCDAVMVPLAALVIGLEVR